MIPRTNFFVRSTFCLALASAASSAVTLAQDMATTRNGAIISGSLVSVAPDGIDIEERGTIRKVSIVDLVDLAIDGEPESLRDARRFLQKHDPAAALEELGKISEDDLKGLDPRVRDEYDYVKIAASALKADASTVATWEQQLVQYLQKNARSHLFYGGSEILGEVRGRMGKYAEAAEAYRNLDRGPAAMQIRSATARADLLMQQGKFPEAIKELQAAERIETKPEDAASARQKLAASLGRARCLSKSGKATDGVLVAQAAIRAADPLDKDLLADGYNALGMCQRAVGGKDQDAIIAFLTVDLVYNGVPSAHAEALYNLISLWNEANQPERARQATQLLLTSHPQSPWAAKVAEAGKSS